MPLPRNRRPRSSAHPIGKLRASTSIPQTDSDESPQPDFDLSPSTIIPQLNTKRDLSIETANATSLGRDNLAWYVCGQRASDRIVHMAEYTLGWLDAVYDIMTKMGAPWPTTWEVAEASLREEENTPMQNRELSREYAYFVLVGLKLGPKGARMIMPKTKAEMQLRRQGDGYVWPAIDCPPWMLDAERDKSDRAQIIDGETGQELEAVAIMTYFTSRSDIESRPRDRAEGPWKYKRRDINGNWVERDCIMSSIREAGL